MFSTVLSTRSYDGYAVVELRGELDLADAAAIAAGLARVAEREPGIILDLAGLSFIDCSGVAALERARSLARQAGGGLVLAGPQRSVTRVLAVLRLPDAFSIYATVEEAAREARHIRAGGMPELQRPRKARWPHSLLWSRTHGLRMLPRGRPSAEPVPAIPVLLPPTITDPEEQADRSA
jgi:anti-sigma B factor antagonist